MPTAGKWLGGSLIPFEDLIPLCKAILINFFWKFDGLKLFSINRISQSCINFTIWTILHRTSTPVQGWSCYPPSSSDISLSYSNYDIHPQPFFLPNTYARILLKTLPNLVFVLFILYFIFNISIIHTTPFKSLFFFSDLFIFKASLKKSPVSLESFHKCWMRLQSCTTITNLLRLHVPLFTLRINLHSSENIFSLHRGWILWATPEFWHTAVRVWQVCALIRSHV